MESVSAKKTRSDTFESFRLKIKAVAYSLIHLLELLSVAKLRRKTGGIQLRPAEIIKIAEWKSLIDSPAQLKIKLPEEVSGNIWDVILVDAPPCSISITFPSFKLSPAGIGHSPGRLPGPSPQSNSLSQLLLQL